jgi:CheY-like chemotaxis protein
VTILLHLRKPTVHHLANQVVSSTPARLALVVDDHPINRLLMQALLSKAGWATALAESAAEAMAVLTSGLRADVIFMDIRMPDVDGYAATRQIRHWEELTGHARTPIIALSADVLDETRIRALAVGMDGFLTKPLLLESLTATLAGLTQS